METKRKKIKVEAAEPVVKLEITEDSFVGTGNHNPKQKLVISQQFRVLKSFTVDKFYHVGDVVSLSNEGVIKQLKINKYIK